MKFFSLSRRLKITAVLIICSMLLCSCTRAAGDSTESTDTAPDTSPVTAAAAEAETEAQGDSIFFTDPYTVYGYELLTESERAAYGILLKLAEQVTESGGGESITVTLGTDGVYADVIAAENLFYRHFESLRDILMEHVTWLRRGDAVYAAEYQTFAGAESSCVRYSELLAAADEILASLEHDGTPYGKAYAITRWLTDNVTYASDYNSRYTDKWLWSAYGALLEKECVCAGYASAFSLLCAKAGLYVIRVSGNTIYGSHEWNMICIDGEWYHVDTTWMASQGGFERYFMMSDDVCFSDGHLDIRFAYHNADGDFPVPKASSDKLYSYTGE